MLKNQYRRKKTKKVDVEELLLEKQTNKWMLKNYYWRNKQKSGYVGQCMATTNSSDWRLHCVGNALQNVLVSSATAALNTSDVFTHCSVKTQLLRSLTSCGVIMHTSSRVVD